MRSRNWSIVSINMATIPKRPVNILVYTDLSGKEPDRQVGVGMVVTPGSLGGVMASTLV